jgi:hypothetical protein
MLARSLMRLTHTQLPGRVPNGIVASDMRIKLRNAEIQHQEPTGKNPERPLINFNLCV